MQPDSADSGVGQTTGYFMDRGGVALLNKIGRAAVMVSRGHLRLEAGRQS
jgi:hypothetical protein